jgi:nucleoside-diphosphate-sugar epimerase
MVQVATVNLISAALAANVGRLVLLSSTAVYGDALGASSETSPAHPVDPYGAHNCVWSSARSAPGSLQACNVAEREQRTGQPPGARPMRVRQLVLVSINIAGITVRRQTNRAGISKLAAEHHLQAVAPASLEYTILRVHNLYGPRMDFSPRHNTLVARVIASVRHRS